MTPSRSLQIQRAFSWSKGNFFRFDYRVKQNDDWTLAARTISLVRKGNGKTTTWKNKKYTQLQSPVIFF